MARVWSSIRTSVLLVAVALSAVLLTVGPFDPDVSGDRSGEHVPVLGRAPTADRAAWDAFAQDLQGWSGDTPKLVSLGQADCACWREGVLPVGEPAATMGQDVADPQADAIAAAAKQHLCPELR